MNRASPHRSERGLPCRSDRGRHRSDHHRERVDGRIGLALQVRAARLVAHARVPRPVLIGLGHGTTVRVARADTTSGLCGRPPRWPTRVSFHSAQAPTQVSSGQSHMLVAVNRAEQTSARRSARSPGQEPAAHRWWPTVLPPTATARSFRVSGSAVPHGRARRAQPATTQSPRRPAAAPTVGSTRRGDDFDDDVASRAA
jgi:hypothetical protein